MIKLIAALGNNFKEYEMTRHNVAERFIRWAYNPSYIDKFSSKYAKININNEFYHLIYPLGYINLSAKAILKAASFFNIKAEEILVISDDIELDFSTISLKQSLSAKGHNGRRSILAAFKKDPLFYLNIGIGKNSNNIASYVLSRFTKDEEIELERVFNLTKNILENFLSDNKFPIKKSL